MKYWKVIILLILAVGCDPLPRTSYPIDDHSGEEILKGMIKKCFSEYKTNFSDISWSGNTGGSEFSQTDNFIIENAEISNVADLIDAYLDKLPDIRGWTSHGFGRTGDSILQISYKEKEIQHYLDFVLMQKKQDVEVIVLYKGVWQ